MSTPYSLSGSLLYPPAAGQPAAVRAFTVNGVFDSKVEYKLEFPSAASMALELGSITDAKAVLITVETPSDVDDPVELHFNESTDGIKVGPGGFFLYANPNPSDGVDAIQIVTTAAASVQVYVLG